MAPGENNREHHRIAPGTQGSGEMASVQKAGIASAKASPRPVGDPNLRLSHRENSCDYPPPPYRLTVSTYIVSFVPLTALHIILTFLPA